MKIEIKERIDKLKEMIKMMREDEKIFGLVREDRDKIRAWTKEIALLKKPKQKTRMNE